MSRQSVLITHCFLACRTLTRCLWMATHRRPAFLYTTPHGQNPTGSSLSLERKKQVGSDRRKQSLGPSALTAAGPALVGGTRWLTAMTPWGPHTTHAGCMAARLHG